MHGFLMIDKERDDDAASRGDLYDGLCVPIILLKIQNFWRAIKRMRNEAALKIQRTRRMLKIQRNKHLEMEQKIDQL